MADWIANHQPQAFVGVGSVRTGEHATDAIHAGARFVVSPIHTRDIVDTCQQHPVLAITAGFTPTEITTAAKDGADMVKVFPARALGSSYIKDILAPMPDLKLIPTGGIGLENFQSYLDAGAIAVGVGGALVDNGFIANREWKTLQALAQQFTSKIG